MISGVLFDLDNTLYDREAAFLNWAADFLRCDLGLTREEDIVATLEKLRELDIAGYGSKAEVFSRLRDLLPHHPPALDMTLAQFYERFLTYIRLEPDTEHLIGQLGQIPLPYGIVTNGGPRQWDKIDRLGLKDTGGCVFVSEDFGCHKPDPDIFLAAARCIGVPPEDTLFVGDNPIVDIGGAKNAGMTTAWLSRGLPWPDDPTVAPPDYTLATLSEVLDILGVVTSTGTASAIH